MTTHVERVRAALAFGCALALPFFTLLEANYPRLTTQGQLAIFALLGLTLAYLRERAPDESGRRWLQLSDLGLALLTLVVFGYVVVQNEPLFERWWSNGLSLGGRAGAETALDIAIGALD